MKDEHKLLSRLRSIKHYFLLDQSDFLVHFMDIASSELNKTSSDISAPRLQSLLDLCTFPVATPKCRATSRGCPRLCCASLTYPRPLHTALSVANNDNHVDDLTSGLERSTIINQLLTIFTEADEAGKQPSVTAGSARLRGWDTFTLDYRAPWPVSLVLSRRSLTKYQVRNCIPFRAVPNRTDLSDVQDRVN
jgi:gamma-tubulin complex component 2